MAEVHSAIARFDKNVSITMTTELSLSRAEVWDALVNPAQLSKWLGHFDTAIEDGADFKLTYLNGSDHLIAGSTVTCTAPALLEYTWSFNGGIDSFVRITLVPTETGGTTLNFTHENVPVDLAPADAATWHAQFEFLSRWLQDHLALGANLRQRRNELLPQYVAEVAHALAPTRVESI